MKPRIFLLEDDDDIARLVRINLEGAGYDVRIYPRVANFVSDAERERPLLFILDIMVPGSDGFEVCRRIRASQSLFSVPIIFLTAKAAEADRLTGFELGADDYVTKPFSPRELVARIKAVLRRFERPLPRMTISAGDMQIDTGAMSVEVRGNAVVTTATEFRLLQYMARHAGQVFTRDQLLDAVWRDTQYVSPRSVDVYIRKLREKIEKVPEDPLYLKTVRGAGYKFEIPR
jgi:two-component system phosphate regulon response regulator PhoB